MKLRGWSGRLLTGAALGGLAIVGGRAPAWAEDEIDGDLVHANVAEPVAVPEAPTTPAPTVTAVDLVTARLNTSSLLRGGSVVVEQTATGVRLIGEVPSQQARTEAVELARTTPGVGKVDDQLRVPVTDPTAPTRQ